MLDLRNKSTLFMRVGRWIVFWFVLGMIGEWFLAGSWRRIHEVELQRAVAALAPFLGSGDWSDPWESDPRWTALEEALHADLVPLATPTASRSSDRSDVRWVRAPDGDWKLTVTYPLQAHGASESEKANRATQKRSRLDAVVATRTVPDSIVRPVWWLTWGSLAVAFATVTLLLARRATRNDESWRTLFEPWQRVLAATPRAVEARLPGPQEIAHVAAPLMTQLQVRVNHWLSELQEAVGRNELVLSNLNEGIMAVDHQGRTLLMNSALKDFFGVNTDSYLERPYVELVRVPVVVQLIEAILADRLARDEALLIGNPSRHLRLLGAPLPLGNQMSGVLLTVVDNTQLEKSELARREFITGASHELKTPLAAIRAYAETLQMAVHEDPESAPRFLESILQQVDRMSGLVTGMLQLARAESGTWQLKTDSIDAVAALRPCIDAAQGIAASKGVSLQTKFPNYQLLVLGDRDAYQTIASNLLSNAVRYTAEGGRVEIELVDEATCVVMRVTDSGIGIAQQDQERVFERFFRVQKDRASESGGTGLGLAIVKQLVSSMNGTVQLHSQLGQGSRFEVSLPKVGFTQSSSSATG